MAHIQITEVQPGFKGRRAKFRVAVAIEGAQHLLTKDGRSREVREARKAGKVSITYVRGRSEIPTAVKMLTASVRQSD